MRRWSFIPVLNGPRHRVTSLIKPNVLPLNHATSLLNQIVKELKLLEMQSRKWWREHKWLCWSHCIL